MIRTKKTGYSFIEVLVAIAILLIAIVGPITIASTGLKNAVFAREQNTAFFLAQEGLEGILYLRENAGLTAPPLGIGGSWNWVSLLPAACFSSTPCRIEIDTHTVTVCNPISRCDLNLHSSGDVRYRHATGGEDTPYSRQLFFRSISGALHVRSVVSWQANAFGGTREVELETYLYDIYDD